MSIYLFFLPLSEDSGCEYGPDLLNGRGVGWMGEPYTVGESMESVCLDAEEAVKLERIGYVLGPVGG